MKKLNFSQPRHSLKAEMTRKKVNQKQLAEILEISVQSLSAKIAGRAPFKDTEIVKLSELFGCSTDYILELSDERLRRV